MVSLNFLTATKHKRKLCSYELRKGLESAAWLCSASTSQLFSLFHPLSNVAVLLNSGAHICYYVSFLFPHFFSCTGVA